MFYFFGKEPSDYDFDFFVIDSNKLIHISTAGMILNDRLLESIVPQDLNFKSVLRYRRKFSITTENIIRDNISDMQSYVHFFNYMASKGFYSYDKVNIDDPFDTKFQLISVPIYDRKILVNNELFKDADSKREVNFNLNFIEAKNDFPVNAELFSLDDYL